MKFSKRKPFVIKNKQDEELLELMKMFEQYLEERQEKGIDSQKYLDILRGKKPKK
jgi:hypothetical protein